VAARLERSRHPSTIVLAYHNVVPSGERVVGDDSLHIEQATFADQLDFLLEGREVVELTCLSDESGDERSSGSRVVITFDDAYRGAMTVGLQELAKRGLDATVFVSPGLLGSDGFWWDRLAPIGGGPLPCDLRRHALEELEGRSDRVFEWAALEHLPLQPIPDFARPVDEDELERLALEAGACLGAHTWSHPNLAALLDAEAALEMKRSRDWLESRSARYSNWLAYPYGLLREGIATLASDFAGAVLVDGGPAQTHGRRRFSSFQRVPRLTVPRGLSLDGLALRLAGLGG
jgi:peptidoglycan/xylan/chitin deacetylase (PgdA/CDA1 family)